MRTAVSNMLRRVGFFIFLASTLAQNSSAVRLLMQLCNDQHQGDTLSWDRPCTSVSTRVT